MFVTLDPCPYSRAMGQALSGRIPKSCCSRYALVAVGTTVIVALAADIVAAEPGKPSPHQRGPHGRGRAGVYTWVPPPDAVYDGSYGRDGVYFYGKDRMEVPGVVAVNRPPYVCDLDGRVFRDKGAFVAHLRTTHVDRLQERPDPSFVVRDGQVHFTGR